LYVKFEIKKPTRREKSLVREIIDQKAEAHAQREKAEEKADFWMKNATRNEEQRVSQNISLISSIRSLKG